MDRLGMEIVWAEDREHRAKVLVRDARSRDDRDAPDVITDIGSTHSHVTSSISENLEIYVESTFSEITILNLLGQSVLVNKLYKNLMEFPFGEFELILGMDWLVEHHVSFDCASKRVVLRTEDDKEVVGDFSVGDIRTVRDFSDVFLEELLGLPSNREFEFCIELLSGTVPVSIAPYQMAPKELTKLKT
ncbi:uncharacterized protein [Gossypium hirsutum]|uniref:RVP_2 domain-containing protein n=1 Tax=Gossypium hirsutum TaxID=3635 RepID=A0ABM2ZDE2_GOSHI|nr:uncharacterized protein LOC121212277 [Gossypium hirsutum]